MHCCSPQTTLIAQDHRFRLPPHPPPQAARLSLQDVRSTDRIPFCWRLSRYITTPKGPRLLRFPDPRPNPPVCLTTRLQERFVSLPLTIFFRSPRSSRPHPVCPVYLLDCYSSHAATLCCVAVRLLSRPTATMVLPGPLIETWALYSVGSLIIFARIACRWRMIGISSFQADDYLIVLAWVRLALGDVPRSSCADLAA